jgi:Ricin-type beta-trefoil lectin domain
LSGTQAHQRFRITQAGTTGGRPYFRIRPTHVSNMCFDVEGASLNDGARVVQFPCISGNRNQQFFLDAIFPGATIHTITPRHSGKRLDIFGASTASGAGLQQFTDTGGRNQRFLLTKVG